MAASVTALLLVEKLGIDVVLPSLAPSLEALLAVHGRHMTLLVAGLAIMSIFFWGVGTLLTLPALLRVTTWKIQANRHTKLLMLFQSLPLIVFNFLLGVVIFPLVPFLLPDSAFDFAHLPTTAVLCRDITVWMVVEEVFFFYLHRLMHENKWLYQTVHKIHHKWHAPVALIAIYCHPVEHLLCNILPLLLGPLLCGSHIAASGIYLATGMIHTTAVHSGYWCCDDNGMHDEHHAKLSVNFGIFGVMDTLYGTYRLPVGAVGGAASAPAKAD